jgi:hypothetical protein
MSEGRALDILQNLRDDFRRSITDNYELRAKPCSGCDTTGACCLDAHFVNVRISRLEAVAIRRELDALDKTHRESVYARIDDAIRRFRLDGSDDLRTYACPLYKTGVGCLVHDTAKPLPCIQHACYENKKDLPPDDLLEAAELEVGQLNRRVYGRQQTLLPLPVAVRKGDTI